MNAKGKQPAVNPYLRADIADRTTEDDIDSHGVNLAVTDIRHAFPMTFILPINSVIDLTIMHDGRNAITIIRLIGILAIGSIIGLLSLTKG